MDPGKIILSDQYESRFSGRLFGNRGSKITSKVYKVSNIFYDAYYKNISVHHQVSFIAEDTTMSNLNFERGAMGAGVPVESYYTYNGIYISK